MSNEDQGIELNSRTVSLFSRSSSQASSLGQDSATSVDSSELSRPHPDSSIPSGREAPALPAPPNSHVSFVPPASPGQEASAERITRPQYQTAGNSCEKADTWIAKVALVISIVAIVMPIVVGSVAVYYAHDDAVAARLWAHEDAVAARRTTHNDSVNSFSTSHKDAMAQPVLAGFNLYHAYPEMQDSTFDLQHANGKLDSTKSNPLYKVGEKEKGVQSPEESMRRPQTKVDQIPSETEKGFVRVTQYIPNRYNRAPFDAPPKVSDSNSVSWTDMTTVLRGISAILVFSLWFYYGF